MNMTRRDALKRTALLGATATIVPGLLRAAGEGVNGGYNVDPLPYSVDGLEPAIDARTMRIHHDRHYAGYVRKLNAALQEVSGTPSLETLFATLDEQPASVKTSLQNNGGGTYNHALFWKSMAPTSRGGGVPNGKLAAEITREFGSFANFQEEFSKSAGSVFGSGWAWLIQRERDGKLMVTSTSNQDNPLMKSVVGEANSGNPLLGLDVWEHAYYLHYQNRRSDYISNWWKIVNWQEIENRMI